MLHAAAIDSKGKLPWGMASRKFPLLVLVCAVWGVSLSVLSICLVGVVSVFILCSGFSYAFCACCAFNSSFWDHGWLSFGVGYLS